MNVIASLRALGHLKGHFGVLWLSRGPLSIDLAPKRALYCVCRLPREHFGVVFFIGFLKDALACVLAQKRALQCVFFKSFQELCMYLCVNI